MENNNNVQNTINVDNKVLADASIPLCPYCGTDTLITLSNGVYCMNDSCDYYMRIHDNGNR